MDEILTRDDLTATDYFNYVKDKRNTITDEQLCELYDNALELLNKYKLTGQVDGMRKAIFHLENICRERDVVEAGVNQFVYRDDIEYYISNVASNVVKIIELERYTREIPDEVVEIVAKVGKMFDKIYVLFTDYSGFEERKAKSERKVDKENDPIMFGTFQDEATRSVIDRFYFIADWEDEYCDLTFDKFVNETSLAGRNVVRTINTPEDIQELKEQLKDVHINVYGFTIAPDAERSVTTISNVENKTFIQRIVDAVRGIFG